MGLQTNFSLLREEAWGWICFRLIIDQNRTSNIDQTNDLKSEQVSINWQVL